jgi:hypothetical protein
VFLQKNTHALAYVKKKHYLCSRKDLYKKYEYERNTKRIVIIDGLHASTHVRAETE